MYRSRQLALAASSAVGLAAATTYAYAQSQTAHARGLPHEPWANVDKPLPNRADMFREIERKRTTFEKRRSFKKKKENKDDAADGERENGEEDEGKFDVLVIGGGATGSGVALDAQTRGLNVILVERDDFASGTSSKSTKLVHGGVRYLEKAVFNLDYGQLKLVFEALKERKVLLHNAPHLSHVLMIATPCYEWYEVPYYWAGMKAYDLVAGTSALTFSSFATSSRTIMEFPTVAKRKVLIDDEEEAKKIRERDDVDEILSTEEPTMGKSLKGSILYSDGQFDDARLNVALAVTAAHAGAVVLNHCSVVELLRDDEKNREKITGAILKDEETEESCFWCRGWITRLLELRILL
jgi:glycerol-3-phosphate dehydrogenase